MDLDRTSARTFVLSLEIRDLDGRQSLGGNQRKAKRLIRLLIGCCCSNYLGDIGDEAVD